MPQKDHSEWREREGEIETVVKTFTTKTFWLEFKCVMSGFLNFLYNSYTVGDKNYTNTGKLKFYHIYTHNQSTNQLTNK